MISKSNSYPINSDSIIMTDIIIDIEAQNENNQESNKDLSLPLKGILKKSDENMYDDISIQERIQVLLLL